LNFRDPVSSALEYEIVMTNMFFSLQDQFSTFTELGHPSLQTIIDEKVTKKNKQQN